MELEKVTSKGQITILIAKKSNVKKRVRCYYLEETGQIYLTNSSAEALREAQTAFHGEAKRVGLKTEEDVVAMIKKMRKEKRNNQNV